METDVGAGPLLDSGGRSAGDSFEHERDRQTHQWTSNHPKQKFYKDTPKVAQRSGLLSPRALQRIAAFNYDQR